MGLWKMIFATNLWGLRKLGQKSSTASCSDQMRHVSMGRSSLNALGSKVTRTRYNRNRIPLGKHRFAKSPVYMLPIHYVPTCSYQKSWFYMIFKLFRVCLPKMTGTAESFRMAQRRTARKASSCGATLSTKVTSTTRRRYSARFSPRWDLCCTPEMWKVKTC